MLRGIPQILTTDEIKQNFADVEFELISGARMHKKIRGTGTNLSLILVQLANTYKNRNILNLTNLGHLLIKVDNIKPRPPSLIVTDARSSVTTMTTTTGRRNVSIVPLVQETT